jgi:rubrerythrin
MRLTELTADLQALRENIADELASINRYEAQAFTLADEEAKEVVQRIVEEEKEHVARLVRLLGRLDVKQREALERA